MEIFKCKQERGKILIRFKLRVKEQRSLGLNLKIHNEFIYKHRKIDYPTISLKGAQKLKEATFEKVMLEAVDEALASLGESVRQAIYFHLEKKFKIAKNEIPNRIDDFAKGLEKIFGLGARFIEILIMKNLYGKIGEPLKWEENKEFSFIGYVEAAKQTFLEKEKIKA